ncbi:DUF4350 domain-containing protein [Sungkyunkwania multivorans]|uniref:DUF4350 domain-containing protein n=1 Tax=Sungkyunkwania multivorans TaxID=1173618 RepID=A0ABW3CVG7_9FLAO
MSRNILIAVGLIAVVLLGMVLLDFSVSRKVDWQESYSERHSKPYGTLVFHEQLPSLFPKKKIRTIYHTPYNYLIAHSEYSHSDHIAKGIYMVVGFADRLGYYSVEELKYFVETGNSVFISGKNIPALLNEILHTAVDSVNTIENKASLLFEESALSDRNVVLDSIYQDYYFRKIPTDSIQILGKTVTALGEKPNYIRVQRGEGAFYVHLQPKAFTNYQLLKEENYKYIEGLLSYLPNEDIYYDSYYKYYDDDTPYTERAESHSNLSYLKSQDSFRWAWYVLWLFVILFMIFAAKRRQRVIKIISPLQNTSLAFVKTIANLYFDRYDHENLIHKKITYFLERIRTDFRLQTEKLDDHFIEELTSKSGQKRDKVAPLIHYIVWLKNNKYHGEQQLIALNKFIEDFYTS